MKSGVHGVVGYVGAVLAASATFILVADIYGYFFGGALSAVYPFSERMRQLFITSAFMFFIITFCTFFTAFIPVLAVHKLAERYSINHILYYLVCGALTGVILSPVAIFITPRMYSAPPVELPLYVQALNFCRFSIPGGAIGGMVYWWLTGRFVKRPKSIIAP